jgi:hypothetical protein
VAGPGLWVVCPVFLDVESFLLLRKRLLEVVGDHDELRMDVRFVVLDDTAGDDPDIDTLDLLGDVRVIGAPFNLGHQRAIVYALRTIAPEIGDDDLVVTLDSDGEDRPEDLPRLLAPLLADPSDRKRVVLARRTRRHTSWRFKVMYLFFTILFRLLTGTSVRTGNYAAYRGWQARRMLLHPYFDLCYSATLLSLQLPIALVPCERGPRYAGRSRMDFSKLFMHGLRMLMPFIDRIAMRALLLFSITLALSIIMSLVVLGIRVFTDAAIPGWATYTLIGVVILSFVALGSFVTLFAVFSQSRAISLSNIDQGIDGRPRNAPPATD